MMRKNISSGSPYEHPIGFSRAVRVGSFLSISGTAPNASDCSVSSLNDVYGQTKRCPEIISNTIKEAGGSLKNIIRTRIMLKDIYRWEEAAKAHGELFSDIKPACTFVEVKGFIDPNWLIEIEANGIIENDILI